MIPMIVGITFISFCAMSLVPGNFVTQPRNRSAYLAAVIKQMEAEFGLDQPLMVRYVRWLWQVVHLNLGVSLAYRVNVTSLIASRAVNTVMLSLASMILSWVLAIPIGVIVAVRQNSIARSRRSHFSHSSACRCRLSFWRFSRWTSRCGAEGFRSAAAFRPITPRSMPRAKWPIASTI